MKLNEYLRKNNISKKEFAKRVGVARMYLHHVIAKRNTPSPNLAKKIEKATNYEVSRLELLYPDE